MKHQYEAKLMIRRPRHLRDIGLEEVNTSLFRSNHTVSTIITSFKGILKFKSHKSCSLVFWNVKKL
jgi:hypothetical protein